MAFSSSLLHPHFSLNIWLLREPLPFILTSVTWRRVVLDGVFISKALCPLFWLIYLSKLRLISLLFLSISSLTSLSRLASSTASFFCFRNFSDIIASSPSESFQQQIMIENSSQQQWVILPNQTLNQNWESYNSSEFWFRSSFNFLIFRLYQTPRTLQFRAIPFFISRTLYSVFQT